MLALKVQSQGVTDDVFAAINDSQAVITFDATGVIRSANAIFGRVMGYDPASLVGRHHRIFVDPTYAASPAYATFWRDIAAGKVFTGEFERRTSDGKTITLAATYSPIRNRAGVVTGCVKNGLVVESSRAANERARRLLETLDDLPVPIMTCDPETFVVDYANRASMETLRKIQKHLPINADKIVGSSIDVFHKNPSHQQKMLRTMSSEGHLTTIRVGEESLELRISRIGGRPVLVWYVVTHRVAMAQGVADSVRSMEEVAVAVASASAILNESSGETLSLAGSVDQSSRQQAAAIGEVAEKTAQAAVRALAITEAARAAQAQLGALVSAVSGVSKVVESVGDIASKTNLLALNATIEAARAGDAGRGFAVVAGEVKALSAQTTRSTEQIDATISDIQQQTTLTAGTVERVIDGIEEITALVQSIAGASEEQRAVAHGVAEAISSVAANAERTQKSADEVAQASVAARQTAAQLSDRVASFMKSDR